MAYRLNFLLLTVVMLVFNLLFPLLTLLIYFNGHAFPGWDLASIILLQGFSIFMGGMQQLLFGYLPWEFSRLVREGEFDRVLHKPMHPVVYLFATNLSLEGVAELLLGGAFITFAIVQLKVQLSLLSIMMSALFMFGGILFIMSLIIIQLSLILRFVQLRRLGEIIHTMGLFGNYPVTIYANFIRIMLIGVLPFTLIAFLPASILLGKFETVYWFALAAGIGFCVIALVSWRSAMRRYGSAGG